MMIFMLIFCLYFVKIEKEKQNYVDINEMFLKLEN